LRSTARLTIIRPQHIAELAFLLRAGRASDRASAGRNCETRAARRYSSGVHHRHRSLGQRKRRGRRTGSGAHYALFFNVVTGGAIVLTPQDQADIVAYLKLLD
jgi:hypothetical protein